MRAVALTLAMLITATALGAGAIGQAPLGDPGQPGCLPGNALENDNVRIWFHGFKGFVKVFDRTNGEDELLYAYTTGAVWETDGEGAQVAHMKLDRAFPQWSACEIEETEGHVNMTLVIDAVVRDPQGGFLGESTATFAYKFNKTANGAKFDVIVDDWPWQSNGTMSYGFTVKSDANMTVASNGIGFTNETGEPRGHIEWAMNATARYDDGSEQEATVVSDAQQSDGKVDIALEFTNVTAGYVQLDYDPWASMGDWIIILDRLISLDSLEQAVPLGLYRTVRNLVPSTATLPL
jgi:hypothetical protein